MKNTADCITNVQFAYPVCRVVVQGGEGEGEDEGDRRGAKTRGEDEGWGACCFPGLSPLSCTFVLYLCLCGVFGVGKTNEKDEGERLRGKTKVED